MTGALVHWRPAYVGVGSNLHEPLLQVRRAIEALRQVPGSRLVSCSSLYRSGPLGAQEQPDFINAVVALLSGLDAVEFLRHLQKIELEQGRIRDPAVRWGPRIIDLDLLVFGELELDAPGISLPHPRIAERNFVLLPLAEIAPELVIPGLGRAAHIDIDLTAPRIERVA